MDSDGNFRFTNFPSHFLDKSYFHGVPNISAAVMLKLNNFFSDYISIESECGLEKVKKTLHKAKKLVLVPNGCALSYFEDDHKVVSKKEDVILAVSRVARQKSLETLIEAFAPIGPNFPEWSVKIVGDIEDQSYYEELVKLIEKLGLYKRVNFEGTVSQEKLLEFYSRSSIFCLSSNWEGDPISRREAIAAGLPVITTEAGCGRSLEKYGSIVVPIGDSTALASGLARLMSDANLRKKNSATQMGAVVSWDDVVEKYISL
jgi:glycosyltransferase involved in cell wall biosynthesis